MNVRTRLRCITQVMASLTLFLFGCLSPGPTAGPAPAATPSSVYLPAVDNQHAAGLIQPGDLVYAGAFRLPPSPGTPENVGWEWGGTALAYRADGDAGGPADGYPGSLYGAGHEHTQHLSEFEIPVPVVSAGKNLAELNVARTLQGFANVRGSLYDGLDWEMPRVGLAIARGKLHF